ncbi:hypothetical protein N824_10540 [Pedobacter sp. V48]|nr:hypothetical protein N824_10540 [Pedobacter sp. V48]
MYTWLVMLDFRFLAEKSQFAGMLYMVNSK